MTRSAKTLFNRKLLLLLVMLAMTNLAQLDPDHQYGEDWTCDECEVTLAGITLSRTEVRIGELQTVVLSAYFGQEADWWLLKDTDDEEIEVIEALGQDGFFWHWTVHAKDFSDCQSTPDVVLGFPGDPYCHLEGWIDLIASFGSREIKKRQDAWVFLQ